MSASDAPLDHAARVAELRAGGPVLHYSRTVRWHHGVLAIAVLVLVVTGFTLRLESLAPLAPWLGGPRAMGLAHRTAGLALGLTFAHHLARVIVPHLARTLRGARRGSGSAMQRAVTAWCDLRVLPVRRDLADLACTVRYWFGRAPTDHAAGRFHVRLKLHYLAVLWGMCAMGGTGLVLAFPVSAASATAGALATLGLPATPAGVIRFAELVHGEEALLVVVVSIVWHLYRVGVPPRLDMITGELTPAELSRYHPAWYEELARDAWAAPPAEERRP